MAVGNVWGGSMADKSKSPDRLYRRHTDLRARLRRSVLQLRVLGEGSGARGRVDIQLPSGQGRRAPDRSSNERPVRRAVCAAQGR